MSPGEPRHPGAASTLPRAGVRFVSELVGREPEVATIEAFLDGTVGQDGGVLLVTGETGVGKTRLAAEASRLAAGRGLAVFHVACQDPDRTVPYAPWVALVREFVATNSRAVVYRTVRPYLSALLRFAPELAEKVWLYDRDPPAVAEWERRPFLAAVAGFFGEASATRPLLLSIDDIGWADAASLELLETVARVCRGKSLAIVATYRDSHLDDNPALRSLLLSVEREKWATKVVLAPFDPAQLGKFLGLVMRRPSVPERFRDLVYEKTRGNPFYTGEILESLADQGVLFRRAEEWDWNPIGRLSLPQTVGGTIRERLARLDEESRRILQVASLLGQEFRIDVLQSVSGAPDDRLLDALEHAERGRWIRAHPTPAPAGEYEFTHPLVQEVLAEEVSLVRARAVHLSAARMLQDRYGSAAESHAATLAFHYLRGGDSARALEFSIAAADQAAAVFARSEAAGHYRNALELLPRDSEPELFARMTEGLADQERGLSDVSKAAGLYVEAARRWEPLDHPAEAGECLRKAASCWLGPVEEGLELLQRARALLEREPPGRAMVRWHLLWSATVFDMGRIAEADRESRAALELAQRIGDAGGEASALLRLGYTVALDRRADCVALNERAGRIIDREGLVEQSGELLVSRGIAQYHLEGNLTDALRVVEEGIGKARSVGDVELERWWMGFAIPWASLRSGDFRQGLALVEERRRLRQPLSLSGWAPEVEAIGLRAWLSILLGPLDAAKPLLDEAVAAERRRPVWRAEAHNWQFLGRLRLLEGDLPAAQSALERSREIYRGTGPPAWHVFLCAETLRLLVQVYWETSQFALARERADELEQLADRFGSDPVFAHAWRARAICLRDEREGTKSLELLERSRAVWSRLGWKYDFASTWVDSGDIWADLGRPAEAREAYGTATDRLRELGAEPDARRIARKIERLG